jgi:hypothetical protein
MECVTQKHCALFFRMGETFWRGDFDEVKFTHFVHDGHLVKQRRRKIYFPAINISQTIFKFVGKGRHFAGQ